MLVQETLAVVNVILLNIQQRVSFGVESKEKNGGYLKSVIRWLTPSCFRNEAQRLSRNTKPHQSEMTAIFCNHVNETMAKNWENFSFPVIFFIVFFMLRG
ncbi:MAG: hypothetical protein RBT80_22220, partial [Candidatus Vecturithrix sp.]|nr:hypothetical protein [Candidatus Vecturithrix sp.]